MIFLPELALGLQSRGLGLKVSNGSPCPFAPFITPRITAQAMKAAGGRSATLIPSPWLNGSGVRVIRRAVDPANYSRGEVKLRASEEPRS